MLVAVVDSPASLAAARAAVDLAAAGSARAAGVHVLADGERWPALAGAAAGAERLTGAGSRPRCSVLRHVADAGRAGRGAGDDRAGARATSRRGVLDEARDWPADLVVLGPDARGAAPATRSSGSRRSAILEFCDRPVLVVPG